MLADFQPIVNDAWVWFLAPIGAILALLFAFIFSQTVMRRSEGDDNMIQIAEAVRKGAMAYLVRQYKVVFFVFVVLVAILIILGLLNIQPLWTAAGVPIAGLFSGLCGWFGMKMATNASARTTFAAKQSLNDGLTVAFRSGAVMGLVVVGFALLDISVWFFLWNQLIPNSGLEEITAIMLTYGMGASTQALFARVGGGIYTKAADVGADLVGKVEAGIPEDDPRNPAAIADNVGDNVGDVAGMGADLYESLLRFDPGIDGTGCNRSVVRRLWGCLRENGLHPRFSTDGAGRPGHHLLTAGGLRCPSQGRCFLQPVAQGTSHGSLVCIFSRSCWRRCPVLAAPERS